MNNKKQAHWPFGKHVTRIRKRGYTSTVPIPDRLDVPNSALFPAATVRPASGGDTSDTKPS